MWPNYPNFWGVYKTMIITKIRYQLLIASWQATTQLNSSKFSFLLTIIWAYHLSRLISAPWLYCQDWQCLRREESNDFTYVSATSVVLAQNEWGWLGQLGYSFPWCWLGFLICLWLWFPFREPLFRLLPYQLSLPWLLATSWYPILLYMLTVVLSKSRSKSLLIF